jgi:hypothetical protein
MKDLGIEGADEISDMIRSNGSSIVSVAPILD